MIGGLLPSQPRSCCIMVKSFLLHPVTFQLLITPALKNGAVLPGLAKRPSHHLK